MFIAALLVFALSLVTAVYKLRLRPAPIVCVRDSQGRTTCYDPRHVTR